MENPKMSTSKEEIVQKDYFFPEYGRTIKAGSLEEAEAKLKEVKVKINK